MWKRFELWFEAYARHKVAKVAKVAMCELSALSDRELKDIGISRGQIREYAYGGKTD